MNLSRIRTIVDKEWAEVFKNRVVLMTVLLMPSLFTLLPIVMLIAMKPSLEGGGDMTDMPGQFALACGSLSSGECMVSFIINQFMLLYMIMPIAIPITIAAYSIVGEKTTRSLEPLLATPITTLELLVGKGLAAVAPAVASTWGCFLVFLASLPIIGISTNILRSIVSPTWLVGVFLVGPLTAIMAVLFALLVSSRVNDPRAAEQISAILIVPFMGILMGQLVGLFVVNAALMAGLAVILIAADFALVVVSVRLFERENILTRWR